MINKHLYFNPPIADNAYTSILAICRLCTILPFLAENRRFLGYVQIARKQKCERVETSIRVNLTYHTTNCHLILEQIYSDLFRNIIWHRRKETLRYWFITRQPMPYFYSLQIIVYVNRFGFGFGFIFRIWRFITNIFYKQVFVLNWLLVHILEHFQNSKAISKISAL